MSRFKGDYLGFTYNGIHSSVLGIFRTSNGSRFEENLLPTIQDKTVQIPGGDGTYYFGSYYTQRQFTIPFAFDDLTEAQVEQLRAHFGDKQIHDLVFDERPYKIYSAKVTGTTTLKHIPFDEGEGRERIYKGEGSIQFTCYQPYAICKTKYLSEYNDDVYPNKIEWGAASGLLSSQDGYDIYENGQIQIYNPGVKETDWVLELLPRDNSKKIGNCFISIEGVGALKLSEFELKTKGNDAQNRDCKITINSKTNLIEGWYKIGGKIVKSGNLYNEYVAAGDFFKIPVITKSGTFFKVDFDETGADEIKLQYSYYYY